MVNCKYLLQERRRYRIILSSVQYWLRYFRLSFVFLDSGWTTCIMPSSEDIENGEGKLSGGVLGILEKITWKVKGRDLQSRNT